MGGMLHYGQNEFSHVWAEWISNLLITLVTCSMDTLVYGGLESDTESVVEPVLGFTKHNVLCTIYSV